MVRSHFADLGSEFGSLVRACLLVGEAAASHFNVESESRLFEQIFPIRCDMQKLAIAQGCVMSGKLMSKPVPKENVLDQRRANWQIFSSPEAYSW